MLRWGKGNLTEQSQRQPIYQTMQLHNAPTPVTESATHKTNGFDEYLVVDFH